MCLQAGSSQVIASPLNISTSFSLNCSFSGNTTTHTLSQSPFFSRHLSASTVPQEKLRWETCPLTSAFTPSRSQICCPPFSETLCLCGQRIYPCLPQAWNSICTLVFLVPDRHCHRRSGITYPLTTHFQAKRAIQAIPLLATLGITAAVGTGATGMGTSIYYYPKLHNQLTNDLQTVAESILTLQKQLDSLASVIPKNR
jgi:hypothetical protein